MDYYQGVNRANDGLDYLSSLVDSKREFIFKQFLNSVLLFIILMVFGCLDFAQLTFHFEYLFSISYWGTIGTKLIAALCAFNVGINMMIDNEIKKNIELQEQILTYKKLIKFIDTDFEYFVTKVFNVNLKISIYKSTIAKKIFFLNRISRAKDRLLYSSELPERQEEKKHNWYCIRRAELEQLRSDEYIKKNIDSIKVKFKEVDPAAFELEINGEQKVKGVKVTGNLNVGRAKESTTIVLTMLLFSMITTSFGLTANKEQFENQMIAFWHYFLKAAEDVGVVIWQFIKGSLRTRKIVSAQLTRPYAARNQILKEYINWKEENKKASSPSFDKIHEEDDVVEIEVTPEELNALQGKEKDPN